MKLVHFQGNLPEINVPCLIYWECGKHEEISGVYVALVPGDTSALTVENDGNFRSSGQAAGELSTNWIENTYFVVISVFKNISSCAACTLNYQDEFYWSRGK